MAIAAGKIDTGRSLPPTVTRGISVPPSRMLFRAAGSEQPLGKPLPRTEPRIGGLIKYQTQYEPREVGKPDYREKTETINGNTYRVVKVEELNTLYNEREIVLSGLTLLIARATLQPGSEVPQPVDTLLRTHSFVDSLMGAVSRNGRRHPLSDVQIRVDDIDYETRTVQWNISERRDRKREARRNRHQSSYLPAALLETHALSPVIANGTSHLDGLVTKTSRDMAEHAKPGDGLTTTLAPVTAGATQEASVLPTPDVDLSNPLRDTITAAVNQFTETYGELRPGHQISVHTEHGVMHVSAHSPFDLLSLSSHTLLRRLEHPEVLAELRRISSLELRISGIEIIGNFMMTAPTIRITGIGAAGKKEVFTV